MAKSDSFFIRASVTTNGTTYAQSEIDLGSFVNLGVSKSTLLRIHNIAVQYVDNSGGPGSAIYETGATPGGAAFQLCTQTQSALVRATDKSLVASGSLTCIGDPNSTAHPISNTEVEDLAAQMWTQGYLVGVDSMFLGVGTTNLPTSGEMDVCIVLECTLESATQANSVALALSQQ
jgi:hypothetical protein